MLFKNYIWDYDGTLTDTYRHEIAVLWNIMKKYGLNRRTTKKQTYALMRVGYYNVMALPGMTDEIYAEFRNRGLKTGDEEAEPRILFYGDCEAVFSAICEKGGRNFIYTHRDASSLGYYLEASGLDRYITDRLTADEGFPMKPEPDALLELIRRNGLDPSETIMTGDRVIDGLAGKNAGIRSAIVNWAPALPDGTSPAVDAARRGIDYICPTLTDFALTMGIFDAE